MLEKATRSACPERSSQAENEDNPRRAESTFLLLRDSDAMTCFMACTVFPRLRGRCVQRGECLSASKKNLPATVQVRFSEPKRLTLHKRDECRTSRRYFVKGMVYAKGIFYAHVHKCEL